jgi:hypothetical protein
MYRHSARAPHSLYLTCASFESLCAFLDARRLTREPWALIAPCDATLEAEDPHSVTLATRDGRRLKLRRPYWRQYLVPVDARVGEPLRAGDRITRGERSHHALLHAIGEDALVDHMLGELELFLGATVPRAYWSLVLRAMLAWHRIDDPGDTALTHGSVIAGEALEPVQRATRDRGGAPATTTPVLRGIGSIAREHRSQRATS